MKNKRYASGGMTQADIDAGLTQADVDAGLRAGRNDRISDDDRAMALRLAGTLSDQQAADLMGREVRMPEARPVPVVPRRAITPRPLSAAPAELVEMPEEGPSPTPGANRRPPPSPGRFDRNPVGDLIDMVMRNTGNARRSRAEAVRAGRAVEGSFKKGGSVKFSASKRADGCAVRGKTKGRMV